MDVMIFDKVRPRRPIAAAKALFLAFAGMALAGFAGAAPARAQEDTNPLNSVLGFVGMQSDKDKETIDYRARPPIVVPPKMDLPAPKEAARDPSWPTDPDVEKQRRAALDSRQRVRPAPYSVSEPDSPREASDLPSDGPNECEASAGTPFCLYGPWKVLQSVIGGFQPEVAVQPGEEPSRKYLTEPPPGYRSATAVAKPDAPKAESEGFDPFSFFRSRNKGPLAN
jgi:hypothetical protein